MAASNRLIFGLMNFGPNPHPSVRVTDMGEFQSCLQYFKETGNDEVDTARVYCRGEQEAWSVAAGVNDMGFTLATKWYPRAAGDHKPEMIRQQLDESLKQLKRDSVDIFYLHNADRTTPFAETMAGVDALYKEGKFKIFAISNFTAAEVAEVCTISALKGYVRPTLYQGPYNMINRAPEAELIPVLRRFGVDYVCFNPIAGGLLTPKWKGMKESVEDDGGRFSASSAVGKMYRDRYFKDNTWNAIQAIDEAGEKHGIPLDQVAYRWMNHHSGLKSRSQGGNDGIIMGASSLKQLKQNISNAQAGPLPQDVVDAIDASWITIGGTAPSYFHLPYEYKYDTVKAIFGDSA